MATQTPAHGSLFVRTIKGVLEGLVSTERLGDVIADSRQSIQEHDDAFHMTLESLTPEVREVCQPLIDAADELLASLHHSLELATAYIAQPDPQLLYDAGALADRGAFQLNILFFELRNTALKAQGPTDIPNLNLLLQCWERCQHDLKQGRAFREVVEAERIHSVTTLEDLQKAPNTPEIELLRAAWDTHLRCMNRTARDFDAGDKEAVVREVENAKTTFTRIKEVLPAAQLSVRTQGPTPDKQANLVISLARDVEKQAIHETLLVDALNDLYKALKQTQEKFEATAKSPTESVMVQDEIDRTREAFELQDTALREFAQFIQSRNLEYMESAIVKLERSAAALYECYEQFQSIADREGKTLCFRCSHYNPANRKSCEKCGATLPVMAQETSTSTVESHEGEPAMINSQGPVLTDNMVRMYRAVDGVFEGKISKEKFLDEVTWFEGLLRKHAEWEQEEPDLDALPEDERGAAELAMKALEEAQELFHQGWDELQAGCEQFRNYVESENRSQLEEGVRLCDSGSRKLFAVKTATKAASAQAAPETSEAIG